MTFSLTFGGSVTAADLNEGRKQSIKIRIAKKLKVATGAVDIKTVRDARRRLLAVTMDVEIKETDEQAAEFSAMEADVVSATEEAVVDSGLDTTVSIMLAVKKGFRSYWSIESQCPDTAVWNSRDFFMQLLLLCTLGSYMSSASNLAWS